VCVKLENQTYNFSKFAIVKLIILLYIYIYIYIYIYCQVWTGVVSRNYIHCC